MKDKVFKWLLGCSALALLFLMAGVVYLLVSQSLPAFKHFGFLSFITSLEWDSGEDKYGAFSFIAGTLLTSVLALLICIPFSISIALFNGEFFKGRKVAVWLTTIVDLLSGIPSIVLGIWGYYSLRPLLMLLNIGDYGCGVLTTAIVLAIMIIPYAASLSTVFISKVPKSLKEGAYGLGATQWEVIRRVSIPFASRGIWAAYMLSFGRVLGETMVVVIMMGRGNTMTSVILNQFGTSGDLKLSALLAIALLLFLVTAVINLVARSMIRRVAL